ncbi:MAG: hypothetical protein JST90_17780 [Bacteroidetes bacterium]|nr:hypothetical protein [Bacteroidota bacterium]
MNKIFRFFLIGMAIMYLVPMLLFTTYLQIKNGNGIKSRFESVIEGIMWPRYLLRKQSAANEEIANSELIYKSLKYHKAASDILLKKQAPIESIDISDLREYIDTLRLAQIEASKVDTVLLREEDSLFARKFIDDYLLGLKLSISGYEKNSWVDIRLGSQHFSKFLTNDNI